jgi:hypothetical protein
VRREPRELRLVKALACELGPDLLDRLAERERLGLREAVGERETLLSLQTTGRVDGCEEVECDAQSAVTTSPVTR